MPRSKVNHSKNISSKEPVKGIGSVSPGEILLFNYKGDNVYDRSPLVMILNKESNIIHGVNLNYLKEFVVQRLLTETNFRKLQWYSLYTKAFRTYSISRMSSLKKISYSNPKFDDGAQDLMDDILKG